MHGAYIGLVLVSLYSARELIQCSPSELIHVQAELSAHGLHMLYQYFGAAGSVLPCVVFKHTIFVLIISPFLI